MNDERLIELVRQNAALYDLENAKYSDNNYKEKIWTEIAKELDVAQGQTCKNRWNQLRDQWRKSKKNKVTKSGQTNKPVKKWRYEEEMGFLEPFLRQRETIGNLNDIDVEDEQIKQENVVDTKYEENTTVTEAEIIPVEVTMSPTDVDFTPKPKKRHISVLPKEEDESASTILMKYLVEKQKTEETSRPVAKDPTDTFFESIAAKVTRFTPYYKNIAETRIFNLVQELELEQILQKHPQPQQSNVSANQSSGSIPPSTPSPDTIA